jgi:hypothetical protein
MTHESEVCLPTLHSILALLDDHNSSVFAGSL